MRTDPADGPALVLLAAGMGSRFGGMKQLAPVGPAGETLMDYSIYDALRAGFTSAVFVMLPVPVAVEVIASVALPPMPIAPTVQTPVPLT